MWTWPMGFIASHTELALTVFNKLPFNDFVYKHNTQAKKPKKEKIQ